MVKAVLAKHHTLFAYLQMMLKLTYHTYNNETKNKNNGRITNIYWVLMLWVVMGKNFTSTTTFNTH